MLFKFTLSVLLINLCCLNEESVEFKHVIICFPGAKKRRCCIRWNTVSEKFISVTIYDAKLCV